jgi:RNA polymerase sigma-70 factor (ECF subfamily)
MERDDQLIQQVLSGDHAAYAGLVRAHQARILRLCTSLLGDAALAEDAAQEVFLKAYQKLPSFGRRAAFGTWLYRIAANQCLDWLRRRTRERTESWEALVETSGEPPAVTASRPDPQVAVANTELVRQALARLSPEQRLLLTLREMDGLSYQELAETLACSLDAVRARLVRARQALLAQLRHVLGPGGV